MDISFMGFTQRCQEQMASIADLQEESAALGRTVRSLQAGSPDFSVQMLQ